MAKKIDKQVIKGARKLEKKAIQCFTIAQKMLPRASNFVIENMAVDLMCLPYKRVTSTIKLQKLYSDSLSFHEIFNLFLGVISDTFDEIKLKKDKVKFFRTFSKNLKGWEKRGLKKGLKKGD